MQHTFHSNQEKGQNENTQTTAHRNTIRQETKTYHFHIWQGQTSYLKLQGKYGQYQKKNKLFKNQTTHLSNITGLNQVKFESLEVRLLFKCEKEKKATSQINKKKRRRVYSAFEGFFLLLLHFFCCCSTFEVNEFIDDL